MQEDEKKRFEKILMDITNKYPSISKDELLKMINEKINMLGGMINRDVAALLVAQSLGLDITDLVSPYKRSYKSKILAPGLRGITLIGKVMYVSPVRKISSNNEERTFISVILNDESGQNIEVTFWGNMVHSASKLRMGLIVEIHGGTVKESTPEPRINVNRGSIKIIREEKPTFKNIIGEHAAGVMIDGYVIDLYETDDESYPIAALVRTNESQHRILLTHDQASLLNNNIYAIFKGCLVRSINESAVDLMMSIDGTVDVNTEKISNIKNIISVDELYNFRKPLYVDVKGFISAVNDKIFVLGSKLCIPIKSNILLNDGSFTIKGALFENLYKPNLIIDKFTKIIQEPNEMKKDLNEIKWQINQYYYVYGSVNTINYIDSITTCPSCGTQLSSWEKTCNKCGYTGSFNIIPEISFTIDGTNPIEIILRGQEVETLTGYNEQAIIEAIELGVSDYLKDIIKDSLKDLKIIIGGQLKEIKPLIIGKEVYKLKNNKYDKITEEKEDGREEEKKEASKESRKKAP